MTKSPHLVIARFVARRSWRGAVLWGLIFGIYVASKVIAYATLSVAARVKIAASFSNSVGLDALLGRPQHINSVTGYASWVCLSVMMIIGAIWAFLLATRSLRGEEASGRWELLLAGRNSARQATANVLSGLAATVVLLYVVAATCFIAVGHYHKVGFDTQATLYFALAAIAGAAEFMAFGAFASQLMPTRSRAASVSAGFFGVCFLLKAVADVTKASWVINITPLGWIEKMQPLQDSQPQWLIPIFVFVAVCAGLSIFLAGRRDLNDSVFADRDSAKPRTGLLRSPLGLAVRLSRLSSFSWLLGIGLMALFYGVLTKAAAQAFSDISLKAERVFSRILEASQQHAGAVLYLGIVFLFIMVVMMVYTASAVGAMREDEAVGYLDNLFVRPISRTNWLLGRIGLSVTVVVLAGLLGAIATWIGVASQHVDVTFHTLLLAGVNTIAPALFTLGIGILALGIIPRLTSFIVYGVIAWSFLVQLLSSSGTTVNHWLLDTSILQHVPLAPAASPNWTSAAILTGLGLVAACIGATVFRRRDLQVA